MIQQTSINEITRLHNEIEESLRTSLNKAIRIGELLCQAKEQLHHGELMPWIKENLPFKDRTARRYMNLFENRDKILEAGTITDAYKMLEAPKTDSVSDLLGSKLRRIRIEKREESIEEQREIFEHAKTHPAEVKVGEVEYFKANGFECERHISGVFNGLPMAGFTVIDPEYKKLEELQEPFNHYFDISQAKNECRSLTNILKRIINKYPERINREAFHLNSCLSELGNKNFPYKELITEWDKLEKIMGKIKERLEVNKPETVSNAN